MEDQERTVLDPTTLTSGGLYENIALSDCELANSSLDGLAFESSLISRVRSSTFRFTNAELTDVTVRECDFANTFWEQLRCEGVRFFKSRLTGWNAGDAVLRNVHFDRCKLDFSVLHDARLEECFLHNCDLREADFQSAHLKNVTFLDCDLRNARFAAATLKTVDFRGSHLAGIQIDAGGLNGNIVDPSQLLDVAHLFGLTVKSRDEPDEPSVG